MLSVMIDFSFPLRNVPLSRLFRQVALVIDVKLVQSADRGRMSELFLAMLGAIKNNSQ